MSYQFKEHQFRSPFHRDGSISYVSAPCGSGKTHVACEAIRDIYLPNGNVLYVLPTIELIDELATRLNGLGIEPTIITSDTIPKGSRDHKGKPISVVGEIIRFIKGAPDFGKVLLITWRAFERLVYFNRRENWQIFIDEPPAVDCFFAYDLPRNYRFILDEVDVLYSGINGVSIVTARDPNHLRGIIEDRIDTVDDEFCEFYGLLLSSSHEIFVDTQAWNEFVEGVTSEKGDDDEDDKPIGSVHFVAMLSTKLFRDSIILGANFETSLLFKWFSRRYTTTIRKHEALTSKLRYMEYDFKERMTIYYVLEHDNWSKTFRNKLGKDGRTHGEYFDDVAIHLYKNQPFAYVVNEDHCLDKFDSQPNATRLPTISHGLNKYEHFHNICIAAALNRTPQHSRLLAKLGLSPEEQREALAYEIYHQDIMRTSLRCPDSNDHVRVLVPDKKMAIYLARLFGEIPFHRIPCPGIIETIPMTRRDIKRKYVATKALDKLLRTNRLPVLYNTKDIGTQLVQGITAINVTLHDSMYDEESDKYKSFSVSPHDLIKVMRKGSAVERLKKDRGKLFNSTAFKKPIEHYRTQDNFGCSTFLTMDFDSGALSPQEFIRLFGQKAPTEDRLSFIINNSHSRSPENPNRFHVHLLFKEPAMSVDEHKATFKFIKFKLAQFGYPDKLSGIDNNTNSGVHSFYFPCTNPEYPESRLFETHNTDTEDIARYGLVPFMCPQEESYDPVFEEAVSVGHVSSQLIDQATARVRSMKEGRHHEFFMTGIRLAAISDNGKRLSRYDIRSTLTHVAGAEKHMLKKVKGVMKSLERYGWLRGR